MSQWRDIDYDPFAWRAAAHSKTPTGFGDSFTQGFKRSLPETKSLLYGATAALGGVVGADNVRDWGLKHYQRIHDNEVVPLANQNTFQGSIKGEHSLGQWAGDTLGNFAGQGLQSAAAGLAGAVIGGANPSGPVGAAVGGIGGVLAKEGGKRLITRQVRQLMKEQVAAGASRTTARQAGQALAQRRLAQMGGGALASTGLNIGQEIGIGYSQRAQDAQAAGEALTRQDALRAIGWGIPAGLVDSAAEVVTAGRLLRGASASDHLPRRMLAGATVGAATEGATEGIQAVMERAGANQSLTDREAVDDYIENIAAGALGGGAMGGASGIRRARSEPTLPNNAPNTAAEPATDLPPNAPSPPYAARRLLTSNAPTENTPLAPVIANTQLARRILTGEVLDPQTRLAPERAALPDPKSTPIDAEFTDLSPRHQRGGLTTTATGQADSSSALTPTDTPTQTSPPLPDADNNTVPPSQPSGPLTRALNRLEQTPNIPAYPDSPVLPATIAAATGQPPNAPTQPLALPAPQAEPNAAAPHSATGPTQRSDSASVLVPTQTKAQPHDGRPSLQDYRADQADNAAMAAQRPSPSTSTVAPTTDALQPSHHALPAANNALATAQQAFNNAQTPIEIRRAHALLKRAQRTQQPASATQTAVPAYKETKARQPAGHQAVVEQGPPTPPLERTLPRPISDKQAQQQAIRHWQQANAAQRRALIQQAGSPAHLAHAQPFYALPAQAQHALVQKEKTQAPPAVQAHQATQPATAQDRAPFDHSPHAQQWNALPTTARQQALKALGATPAQISRALHFPWHRFSASQRKTLAQQMPPVSETAKVAPQTQPTQAKAAKPQRPKLRQASPRPPAAAALSQSETKPATSKRLDSLQKSLRKKEVAFKERMDTHFAYAKDTAGQPLAGTAGGRRILKQWDKQNETLKTLNQRIEKTKQALEIEQQKVEHVAAQSIPPPIQKRLDDGTLNQWRKYPNRFFVKGVEKGRIIWDDTERKVLFSHYRQIPHQEQRTHFQGVFNALRQQMMDYNAQQEVLLADFDPATTWDSLNKEERDAVVERSKVSTIRRSHLYAGQPWKHLTKGEKEKLTQSMRARILAQYDQQANSRVKSSPAKPTNPAKNQTSPALSNTQTHTAAPVLQNRNRSHRASIEQMQAIAQRPDYLRTGISRSMDQGAPVVFAPNDSLPANTLIGRDETLTDGTGERFASRYAVIEAADLIASHDANGSPRADYGTDIKGTLHAVAGNGRAAGISESYKRGTAKDYRTELHADAANIGIDPKALAAMKQPVLVRLMRHADLKPDIGDRSNISASAHLSPLEQAANDTRRIDINAIEFDDNGVPTPSSARAFVRAMPESERGPLLNPDGSLTRQGIDRITAAAFHHAYDNDELVRLYAQATDPQARTIISALARAAGSMAPLKGSGEFDIRPAVTEAAIMAVNARRQGRKLVEIVQQKDIGHSEDAYTVADFFARHIRSGKRLAEGVQYLAKHAHTQQQIAQQATVQAGLFGTPPPPKRSELLASLRTYETLQTPPQGALFSRSTDFTIPGEGISKADAESVLKGLAGKPLRNQDTGIEALVNSVQIKKLVSEAAVSKSGVNGFTREQHYAIVGKIKTLWHEAIHIADSLDTKHNDPNVTMRRFAAPIQIAGQIHYVVITAKQTVQFGSRIYTLEAHAEKTLRGTLDKVADQNGATLTPSRSASDIVKALNALVNPVSNPTPPAQSRSQKPTAPLSSSQRQHVDHVQAHVDSVAKHWPAAPKVIVAHDLNDSRVPQAVRTENARQVEHGATGKVEGFFHQGTVYLLAGELNTPADVRRVLFHEVLGHVGLRGAFGTALDQVLKDVAHARRMDVAAKLKHYGLQDTPSNRLIAAEEVLAELAQRKPQLNLVQRALAAIRTWLRRHIPALRTLPLSDNELIRNYIEPARAFVERGRKTKPVQNTPTFERDKATPPAFDLNNLPPLRPARTFKQARQAAKAFQGKPLTNQQTGMVAVVSRTNLDKMLSGKAVSKSESPVLQSTAVANVDMLFKQAIWGWSKPDRAIDSNIKAIHRFFAPMEVDGRTKMVKLTIKEIAPTQQANTVYTVEAVDFQDVGSGQQWLDKAAQEDGITLKKQTPQRGEWAVEIAKNDPKTTLYGFLPEGSAAEAVRNLAQAIEQRNRQQSGNTPLFSRSSPQSVIQAINRSIKGPRGAAWAKVKQLFSNLNPKNLRENTRPTWLGALTLRHLAELGKDIGLKQVDDYANTVQRMATLRNTLQESAAQTADTWERFQRQHKAPADAMANLMFDATLAGVDPEGTYTPLSVPEIRYGQQVFAAEDLTPAVFKARRRAIAVALQRARGANRQRLLDQRQQLNTRWKEEKARLRAYPALQKRFAALPQTGQNLYRQVRDTYLAQSKQMEEALVARIESLISEGNTRAATIARIRQKFESARLRGPYFPLQRFGSFWIQATDKHGESAFMLYETVQAWQQAQRDLTAEGFTLQGAGRKMDDARNLHGASGSFIADLQHLMQRHGAEPALRDEVYQLYLRSLPDVSLRKHYLHRKGTAGYSRDALRAFSANLFHGSFQIARLQFSHELDSRLQAMKAQTKELSRNDPHSAAKAAALYTEMSKRHEWIINPRDSKAANALTSLGFAWYLGATPAAALVNLSQTAIVSLPVLAAKFGTAKALNALTKGMAVSLRSQTGDISRHLTGEERAAYQRWHAMGTIDKSQAHNLAGLSETDSHSFNPHTRRAMHLISWLFHRAEVVNREATALAAYRLARRSGMDVDQAVNYGHEAVMESHFDYSNANRARWMQSNAAKVLLLFRQYSLNMTWFLWRNLYQSLKGQDAQTKKEARTKLAGVLGMTGLFSGVMGLPLMSVLFGVADAAAAAFGDDEDDPFDAKVAFRNVLADLLGPDVARLLAKGPIDSLTGASVGARVSLDELWLRSPNRELEGQAMAHYLLEHAAGPLFGGLLTHTLRGVKQMHDGHTWRGIETMLPKALKDGMKALRYADEGANTLKGDPLISDVGAHESLLQLAGFSPARLNERYEGMNAAKNVEQKLMDRRSRLMNAFLRARQRGDGPAGQRVLDTIRAFNRTQPRLAITADTLRQSLRARQRYAATAFGGTTLNPRIAQQAQAHARFAE